MKVTREVFNKLQAVEGLPQVSPEDWEFIQNLKGLPHEEVTKRILDRIKESSNDKQSDA